MQQTVFFLYSSSKHTSFNMYNISVFFRVSVVNNIPVFSIIVDILVLICTTYTFFSIDILVLIWFSMQRT